MMNDADIIKALECCASGTTYDVCVRCPLYETTVCTEMGNGLQIYALDLINRQKAEIEGLNYIRAELSRDIDHFRESAKMVKSEAIKEFAGRLKVQCFLPLGTYIAVRICTEKEIDNLVKEMTEGEQHESV